MGKGVSEGRGCGRDLSSVKAHRATQMLSHIINEFGGINSNLKP